MKVLGKGRNRRTNARAGLRTVKTMLPNLKSLAVFNAAYPTAQERNAAQIQLLESLGKILVHIMKELKEDDED